MINGVFLDFASLAPQDLDFSALIAKAESLNLQLSYYDSSDAEQTTARIVDAEVIFTNKVEINAEHFQANQQLKLVIILATGCNNVDLDAARHHGVAVSNICDYSTPAVVQHCWSMLLALQTQLMAYQRDVSAGKWSQSQFFGLLDHKVDELAGKTLGLIGRGAIGQGVANIATAFGMRVLWAQSLVSNVSDEPNRVPLAQLAQQADIISLHCPLSEQSHHVIDATFLAQMKPEAFLINVSRGGLVNEDDLLQALQQGQIAAAALDVLEQEPPKTCHPLIAYQAQHANLLITPHSAWSSVAARQRLLDQVVTILAAWQQGQRINPV